MIVPKITEFFHETARRICICHPQKIDYLFGMQNKNFTFVASHTVAVAQLVRASVCGTEGRGFEPHQPPENSKSKRLAIFL